MRSRSDIRRLPVTAASLPALIAFADAHPVAELYATAGQLFGHLVLGPTSIVDLHEDGERRLVAAVVDACDTATNAAWLVVAGAREQPLPARQLTPLFDAAEAIVAAGPRNVVELGLRPLFAPHEGYLQRRGYRDAYVECSMVAVLPVVHTSAPRVEDLAWRDVEAATADAVRALLLAAFSDVPGTGIPGAAAFRERALAAPRGTRRVLVEHDRVVAYVALSPPDRPGNTGSIDVLARHPERRGCGLGERALTEAFRALANAGARRATLEVVGENGAALALYQRHGFETTATRRVLSRAIGRYD